MNLNSFQLKFMWRHLYFVTLNYYSKVTQCHLFIFCLIVQKIYFINGLSFNLNFRMYCNVYSFRLKYMWRQLYF